MAMPPTEIRYNRPLLRRVIAVCVIAAILITVGVTQNPLVIVDKLIKGVYGMMMLGLGFAVGWMGNIVRDNHPVLTLHSGGLMIHRGNRGLVSWGSVVKWKLRRNKNGYYLELRTTGKDYSISLNSLERSERQIEELVASYIQEPGPGGLLRKSERAGWGWWEIKPVR